MKLIPTFILLATLVTSNIAVCQKIRDVQFDKFDSINKIVTEDIAMGENDLSDVLSPELYQRYLTISEDSLLRDNELKKALLKPNVRSKMTAPNIFIRVARFTAYKNKRVGGDNLSAYILFIPPRALILNSKAVLKVLYTDNTLSQYINEAPYKVIGQNDYEGMYFTIPKHDPLRTKKISLVRLYVDDYTLEVPAGSKTCENAINLIKLVESHPIPVF